jgi:hypothetical protein
LTLEQIRKAYDARPFVPFVLHLADGREIAVRSREFMAEPRGRTIAVSDPEERKHVIDILLVTDLEFDDRARTRRGPSEPSPR